MNEVFDYIIKQNENTNDMSKWGEKIEGITPIVEQV